MPTLTIEEDYWPTLSDMYSDVTARIGQVMLCFFSNDEFLH